MDEDNTDVFKLITSLCEKFHQNPDKVKKSRSKCYEILLGKRIPKHKKSFKDLKGTTDPFCNLLSWQLVLIHDYNLKDHSRDIEECVQSVQECYGKRASDCKNILTFLLSLRNIPLSNNRKLDLSLLPPINEFENFNNLFILPESIKHESEQETVNTKSNLFMKSKTVFKRNMFENNSLPTTAIDIKFSELFNDEGYGSPPKTPEFNIWDTACRLQYSNRRNWENFGYPEPDKECRFLSELGDLSSLWVENLESLYMVKLFRDGTVFNSKLKSRKAFIRDLKYLLVGMASESFTFDEKGEFYLVPGIAVDGITPSTLESYCQELVLSGTCYKALNRMSVPDPDTGKYKYEGYIFMEFCESILRYLKFYSTAVFNIPDSTTYLQFHESTYQLRLQISAIASICKVGPYMESEEVPHGVALLNYLYQKVLNSTQEKVIITLYSFLYPCCQVYFSRFLNQWILEGNINDPYGEFFIRPNCKYISTRGRTYWTRSYTILEDIVPDFLIDLRLDLLNCGRTMNLLKLCVHSSKLCLYLMGKKPSLITCCLTSNHLSALRQNVSSYYLEVCSECGPQFDLADVFTRWHEQDPLFIIERQKITQEQNEKKLEEIIFLKEQYDAALEQKQTRIAIEIEKDIKEVQQNLEIELKRQKLIEDETNKLVEHYSKLCQIAEERKLKIKNHIKKINSTHMDENVADKDNKSTEGNLPENNNSSTESFYSVMDESVDKLENGNEQKSDEIHLSDSMDIINANESEGIRDVNSNTKIEMTHRCNIMNNKGIQKAMDNFEMARREQRKK
ncbi:hypothetical protein NQ317_007283 [Molorchus minor]|uniref:Gamma-tubulin complex component n=1 Tax=Molorchus minor TaxID=1323400 RepID=A0ABQ9JUA9_9CUCU|nr:hypothetical protein NQ317_007283 [Molorchus minor]